MLVFGVGGAYGAYRLVDLWAKQAGRGETHLTVEATPFLVLICLVGAMIGAVLGSLFLPTRR